MYDLVLPEASRARYEDLLKEAEQERRALRVTQGHHSAWTEQAVWHLGQWLIDTGSRLKKRVEMQPTLSQR